MPGVLLSARPLPSQIQRIACKDPADCETVASLPKQTPGSQNSPGAHTSLSSGGTAADSREELTTSSSFVSDPTIRNPGPGPHDNSHCAVGSTSVPVQHPLLAQIHGQRRNPSNEYPSLCERQYQRL